MTVLIPIAIVGIIATAIGYYFATHEGKLQQSAHARATRTTITAPPAPSQDPTAAGPTGGNVKFSFPIPGKSSATIFVPADLASDDWEMIDAMIRAYVTRRGKP